MDTEYQKITIRCCCYNTIQGHAAVSQYSDTAVIFQNKENKCKKKRKKNHKWWILKAKAKIPQSRAFKEEMREREMVMVVAVGGEGGVYERV